MTSRVPARVTVTGPARTARARAIQHDSPSVDVSAALARASIGPLIERQLRTGLLVGGCVCCALASLPLFLTFMPALGSARVAGVPLPWLVLGVLVYPVLVLAGMLYVRLAERNEREFVDEVNHAATRGRRP